MEGSFFYKSYSHPLYKDFVTTPSVNLAKSSLQMGQLKLKNLWVHVEIIFKNLAHANLAANNKK